MGASAALCDCAPNTPMLPWLMLDHGGLSILIHPNTTNPKRDHLVDPIWIGRALAAHGEVLREEDEAKRPRR
ncbi:DOPA 4,5-dioxygenase family protein [Mesorhizobium sp. VK9D]|uniref:DOPA 4,5-dioxygenase family protein n=1 Tax=Mesorhizobium australafricanum TaxID=3072311 RepID=UPI002A23BB70|nr:DOPA 4,5-dioxygenase family protein [Mesorhizobium sp. VK9D]MDX8454662.1 DOPA 4,5-dioxygenase family protein [Mesorhizobium sp. VK9D]